MYIYIYICVCVCVYQDVARAPPYFVSDRGQGVDTVGNSAFAIVVEDIHHYEELVALFVFLSCTVNSI
jgi:hypothetical protein